ncbi:MAG TPA: RNA polymerase sigma factor [Terriglobia bacterium]|nr:RNA polymerase sigma factor [Terriglobia bacterium]
MNIKPFAESKAGDIDSNRAGNKGGTESELILRAQRGDEAAFEKLFETHKRRVYAICLRATRNTADAEDLTQDAFLKVFRGLPGFRGESIFSTWLHRLVMNEVLMHLRKRQRAQPSIDEQFSNLQGEPVKIEYGTEDGRLSGCVDRITLDRALAKLPSGYRTAFLLYDVEGYKHSEIARMMNWSVGNSKSQLFKARRKLRAWLGFNPLKNVSRLPVAGIL